MTRPPQSCSVVAEDRDQGLKKGPWTPDEDQKLVAYIQQHGHGSWRSLPVHAGLQRCGKSCRLRWTNYLRPDIKRGRFSPEEDRMIVHLHAILGNRWSAIASHLPRRTDNEIKNYWNTHLKKRLLQMGIDPVTHKPTSPSEGLDSTDILSRPVVSSTLSHMSQWECARAEAEARLSRQSSTVQQQGITSPQGDASTSFMSSWKAQVAETLRPSFGVVELEKLPAAPTANMQMFLLDWELSTSRQPVTTFAAYDSPVEFPDFASSGTVSPQYVDDVPAASHAIPSSAQITERLLASRGSFQSDVESLVLSKFSPSFIENVSPTSTLQGPDHHFDSSSSSPCVSSSTGDSFDLLAHTLGLIHHESENSQGRTGSMFQPAAEPHFWQPLPSVPYVCLPKPSFTNNLTQVAVPNNIPIPEFDFLC